MPQVYTVDLCELDCVPPEWLRVLDDGEGTRANRFVRASDRLAFVAAHAVKRLALAQALPGRDAAALRFGADSFGKPFLTGPAALQFNLSHTTGLTAVAVSHRALGIDVETRESSVHFHDAAPSVLTAAEQAALARAVDWDDAFLALWTAKEAVLKAEGKGLYLPLSEIEVHEDRARGPSQSWTLWRSRPTPRHVLTLAWDGNDDVVESQCLCGDDLTAWASNVEQPRAKCV